jgi:hypothetical protein
MHYSYNNDTVDICSFQSLQIQLRKSHRIQIRKFRPQQTRYCHCITKIRFLRSHKNFLLCCLTRCGSELVAEGVAYWLCTLPTHYSSNFFTRWLGTKQKLSCCYLDAHTHVAQCCCVACACMCCVCHSHSNARKKSERETVCCVLMQKLDSMATDV